MEAHFAVHFMIRKGLGPEYKEKVIEVGLDDIEPDTSDAELKSMAKLEAESYLSKSEDYPLYGKNWYVGEILRT
jgi:hypothetical protein